MTIGLEKWPGAEDRENQDGMESDDTRFMEKFELMGRDVSLGEKDGNKELELLVPSRYVWEYIKKTAGPSLISRKRPCWCMGRSR